MLKQLGNYLLNKTFFVVALLLVVALWAVVTPRNKPPGTAFQIQLDPVHRPIGTRLIRAKSRTESVSIQSRNAFERGGFLYAPRQVELTCTSPINAFLVDLSDLAPGELAALQTHPDARRAGGMQPKPLREYPLLGESKASKRVVWPLSRWSWKPPMYKLVVECPSNPAAVIDVRIDYGGQEWDNVH